MFLVIFILFYLACADGGPPVLLDVVRMSIGNYDVTVAYVLWIILFVLQVFCATGNNVDTAFIAVCTDTAFTMYHDNT